MAIKDNLTADVNNIFKSSWSETNAQIVPVPTAIGMGNQTKLLTEAVVLYADLDGSTSMVDSMKWEFSAEIYKTFLHCAAKIIKEEDGVITAYDGDRIMAIFIGDNKYDSAVRAALKLKWAVTNIIQPAMKATYKTSFVINHVVGVDVSDLRAVRTGVRGDNDLVWVGRAANYAAKMTSLSSEYSTWITKAVYDNLSEACKYSNNTSMWESRTWSSMKNIKVYRSNWGWIIY